MSLVPRLELDRPSLADRIRAFKNSLSSGESTEGQGTFRRSSEQYNSIDDIVSLLRLRAVESLPAEPTEEISSIIEELRSKNSDLSISSPPRELTTAVRVVEKPAEVVNIEDLVRRLTVDDENEEESPQRILARIKSRLEGPQTTEKIAAIPQKNSSVVSSNRVVIDADSRQVFGVGIGPEIFRERELVKSDPLILTRVDDPSGPLHDGASLIPDLVLLPHQLPYIAAESARIRGEIFRKIQL